MSHIDIIAVALFASGLVVLVGDAVMRWRLRRRQEREWAAAMRDEELNEDPWGNDGR